jgi:hypothetical protein
MRGNKELFAALAKGWKMQSKAMKELAKRQKKK